MGRKSNRKRRERCVRNKRRGVDSWVRYSCGPCSPHDGAGSFDGPKKAWVVGLKKDGASCTYILRIHRAFAERVTGREKSHHTKRRENGQGTSETTGAVSQLGASVSRVRWFGHDRSRIHRNTKPLLLWPSAPPRLITWCGGRFVWRAGW